MGASAGRQRRGAEAHAGLSGPPMAEVTSRAIAEALEMHLHSLGRPARLPPSFRSCQDVNEGARIEGLRRQKGASLRTRLRFPELAARCPPITSLAGRVD